MKYENMIYLSSTRPARYQITILSLLSILSINVSKGKKETVLKSSLEFSINQVLLKVLPIEENQIPSEMEVAPRKTIYTVYTVYNVYTG